MKRITILTLFLALTICATPALAASAPQGSLSTGFSFGGNRVWSKVEEPQGTSVSVNGTGGAAVELGGRHSESVSVGVSVGVGFGFPISAEGAFLGGKLGWNNNGAWGVQENGNVQVKVNGKATSLAERGWTVLDPTFVVSDIRTGSVLDETRSFVTATNKRVQGELKVKTTGCIIINGTRLRDVPLYTYKDRTLIPLRIVSEKFGAKVEWDPQTNVVTVTRGKVQLQLIIGDCRVFFNGHELFMDAASVLVNGEKTYVPLRVIATLLGMNVSYDSKTGDVALTANTENTTIEIVAPDNIVTNLVVPADK